MLILLIKASFILAVLLAFYKLFLERESFFAKNRFYLMATLFLTFGLPFVALPELIPDQGVITKTIEKIEYKEPLTQKLEPVSLAPKPEKAKIETAEVTPVPAPKPVNRVQTAIYFLMLLYYFGVLIFALNLFSQIASVVLKLVTSKDKVNDGFYTIINSPQVKEPCSFFNFIFINPEAYEYETYEQILAHERIHVKQAHTIDLLLAELAVIILWFNPLVWMYRKEVEKNIEYQTDDLLLEKKVVEKQDYQMSLLKIATYNKPLTITTNYNQSLIKQRILKMSAQKSNPHSFWKYAFIAPVIFLTLLVLNKPLNALAEANPQAAQILPLESEQKNKLAEMFLPESWMGDSTNTEKKMQQPKTDKDDYKVLRKVEHPQVEGSVSKDGDVKYTSKSNTVPASNSKAKAKNEKAKAKNKEARVKNEQAKAKNLEARTKNEVYKALYEAGVVPGGAQRDKDKINNDDLMLLSDQGNGSGTRITTTTTSSDDQDGENHHVHIHINKCGDYSRSLAYALYEEIDKKGLAAGLAWYEQAKKSKDYDRLDEDDVNDVGYELLYDDENVEAAIAVFKINVEEFPKSWNVYDSLGEAYVEAGNKRLALENYKKSVELDSNNKNGKMIIKALEAR